jgi:predicted Zn finger-like uncharacterized protein
MRITCPNCDAQYEVNDDVIPAGGRDVQCSNCTNTWYQLPAMRVQTPIAPVISEPAPQPAPEVVAAEASTTEAPPQDGGAEQPDAPAQETAPPEAPASEDAVTAAEAKEAAEEPASGAAKSVVRKARSTGGKKGSDTEAEAEPASVEAAEPTPPAASPVAETPTFDDPPPLPRRQLDEEVVSVLRAEAEREAAARQADAARAGQAGDDTAAAVTTPATGTEMTALERLAAAIAAPSVPETAAVGTSGNGHDPKNGAKGADLLPDIDVIRETLRSSSEGDQGDEAAAEEDAAASGRSGFRTGFLTVLLLGVLLTMTYLFAGEIAQRVPQAEPYLRAYVVQVNEARSWVDTMIRSATSMLQGENGEA